MVSLEQVIFLSIMTLALACEPGSKVPKKRYYYDQVKRVSDEMGIAIQELIHSIIYRELGRKLREIPKLNKH